MEKGRVTHSPLFLLWSLKHDGTTRVSATVPQKVVKTAVGRNKLRRKMYDVIQPLFSVIAANTHAVVIAKKAAIDANAALLAKDMKDVFVKAGLVG
jgi:ribonuclease P protein component